jgi:hypothetical protein
MNKIIVKKDSNDFAFIYPSNSDFNYWYKNLSSILYGVQENFNSTLDIDQIKYVKSCKYNKEYIIIDKIVKLIYDISYNYLTKDKLFEVIKVKLPDEFKCYLPYTISGYSVNFGNNPKIRYYHICG